MREKFLVELAKKLCTNKDVLSIYKKLADILEENNLYHEYGAVLEKIWHLTKEHELFKEIGDIFLYQVRNPKIAVNAYNKYLQLIMPDFYKSYATTLYNLGYSDFEYEYDDEDYTKELIDLCDRYNAIIYIMVCLFQNKKYQSVLDIEKYLYDIKNRLQAYNDNLSQDDLNTLQELDDSNRHLSELISQEEHHNDINMFAIRLFDNNQRAYINIIGDLLTYKNYKSAIDFYNNKYASLYNTQIMYESSDLCWFVSDFYRDRFEFYKAIKYQKLALEIDCDKEK